MDVFEKVAQRSEIALLAFTVSLLLAGVGLAGTAFAVVTGWFLIFGAFAALAGAGFTLAGVVVIACQPRRRTVPVGVTRAPTGQTPRVSARYN